MEFEPIFFAVLDDPLVVEFGWMQGTTIDEDEIPERFAAEDFWVRTTNEPPELASELLLLYSSHPTYGHAWDSSAAERPAPAPNHSVPDEAAVERVIQLERAVERHEFDDVLLQAFGQDAAIAVRRDGIRITRA
ncbi:hypothetical protein [Embleya sp. NPDC059237]|uniref:hypothetical protein n=1 Tax=Embleya sp. NPDC059237 TaxID=3346784 RepID=UPI0036C320AC